MKIKLFLAVLVVVGFLCHSKETKTEIVEPITPSLYPMMCVVTEVDYATDIVTIVNFTGFIYQFYGCEDWDVDDICSCIMSDNGTPPIFDDEVISVKYDGWIEGWLER